MPDAGRKAGFRVEAENVRIANHPDIAQRMRGATDNSDSYLATSLCVLFSVKVAFRQENPPS